MQVQLDPVQAVPAMRSLPPAAKRSMRAALAKLGKDPTGRSVGLDVRRLDSEGAPPVHRIKVGDWRAAFIVGKNHVRVVRIFHRSEGYAWLAEME